MVCSYLAIVRKGRQKETPHNAGQVGSQFGLKDVVQDLILLLRCVILPLHLQTGCLNKVDRLKTEFGLTCIAPSKVVLGLADIPQSLFEIANSEVGRG